MNREIHKHWLNTSTWSSSISLVATKHFPFSSSYLNLYKTKSVQWFIFLVGVLLSSVISTVDTFSLLQLKVRWHFSNTILIKFFCKNAHDVIFCELKYPYLTGRHFPWTMCLWLCTLQYSPEHSVHSLQASSVHNQQPDTFIVNLVLIFKSLIISELNKSYVSLFPSKTTTIYAYCLLYKVMNKTEVYNNMCLEH